MTRAELARRIDHTCLRPAAVREEIERLCEEARRLRFASVCLAPIWVRHASLLLAGTDTAVGTVIAFPHGDATSAAKAFQAEEAVRLGARELDMVMNIAALRSGDAETARRDVLAVVEAARGASAGPVVVKAIMETALLDREQKILAALAAADAGADFVKTSTGFAASGATVEDVALLVATVGARASVKASGGIRTLPQALAMLEAGAARLGCSSSVAIVKALPQRG